MTSVVHPNINSLEVMHGKPDHAVNLFAMANITRKRQRLIGVADSRPCCFHAPGISTAASSEMVDYAQTPLVGENKQMNRIAMLSELLSQDPNNAFARYGLAMEYSNSGELDRALEEFGKLLSANPDYTAGYFMAAQTLAKAGCAEEAKQMLGSGISSAQRRGDAHAESEMQAMLEELNGTA